MGHDTDAAVKQSEFEVELRSAFSAMEREVHVADFERMDIDLEEVEVAGKRYRRRREDSPGKYMTAAGMIEVSRATYREAKGRGGKTIAPLELRLGLVDGHWTHRTAEVASTFMAASPSKESAQLLALVGLMKPSASHLDRLPKLWNWNEDEDDQARENAGVEEAHPGLTTSRGGSRDDPAAPECRDRRRR